jgi:hypothetical protein
MSVVIYGNTYTFDDYPENVLNFIPKNASGNTYKINMAFNSGGYVCKEIFFSTDENGELTEIGYTLPVGHVWSKEKGWNRQNIIFKTISVTTGSVTVSDGLDINKVLMFLSSLFKYTDTYSIPEYYYYTIDGLLDNDYIFNVHFSSNNTVFTKITVKIRNGRVVQMLFYKAGSTTDYVTIVHDASGLTNSLYSEIILDGEGNIRDTYLNCYTFLQLFKRSYFSEFNYDSSNSFIDLGGLYGLELRFTYWSVIPNFVSFFPNSIPASVLNGIFRFNETYFAYLKQNPNDKLIVGGNDPLCRNNIRTFNQYYYKLYTPQNVKFNPQYNILSWDNVSNADNYQLEYPNGSGHIITENQDFLYLNGKYILKAQTSLNFISESDTVDIMVTNYNTNIVFGYYNSSESNRLDKTLSQQFEAACTFRNSVSVLNPVIELEMDELPKINYVYLVALHRYYYVTDITIIRNRLYALHLAVDVLMSYKDEILNLNPIIERQENYYNNLLVNDHVITQLKYNYSTQTAEGDISFSMTDLDFIITALTSTDTGNPPVTQQQVTLLSPMCGAYLITSKNAFLQFAEGILNPSFWDSVSAMFTNKGEYIYGIKGINFNIKSTTNLPWTGTSSISLGGKSVTGLDSSNVFIVPMGCTPYLEFRFDIPSVIDNNFAFMRTSPYTEYELFLPFVGWITLDADIIFSQNITYLYIIYYIDVVTLNATVVVSKISATGTQSPIKVRGENILYMTNCNVGVDIPWGTTNINEIYKTITTGAVSLATSAASGFVSYKAANSSANALYPASGRRINNDRQISAQRTRISGDANMAHSLIGGLSNTMNNTVLNLRQRFQHGNIGNGVSDTYVASKPVLRVKYPSILIPDNYSSLYGFPCGSTYKLSNLKGFTIVDRVHMDGFPNATLDEIEEIESILKSGVIL